MALLPSKSIFAKLDTQHPLIISPFFLKVTTPLIYLFMRAFLYKGIDLHLTLNSLPSLCPYSDFLSLFFWCYFFIILLSQFAFPPYLSHTLFLASQPPPANSVTVVLIVLPSPLLLQSFQAHISPLFFLLRLPYLFTYLSIDLLCPY